MQSAVEPSPDGNHTPAKQPVEIAGLNRLLPTEEQAIVDLVGEWSAVDRTHRRLAHRGSYTGSVFVSPTTVQRIAVKHGLTVPGEPSRPPRRKLVLPEVQWERNRIWMWESSEFPTAGRVAYALLDLVTFYWLGYLLSGEHSSAPVQNLYAAALEDQGLNGDSDVPDDDGRPTLVGWSGGGEETMPAGTPTRRAQVESLFGHLRIDWPQLNLPTDPETLDQELGRIRREYNTGRLHAAIGYVTPSDEHQGRGSQIRDAREAGLRRARAQRISHNRGR